MSTTVFSAHRSNNDDVALFGRLGSTEHDDVADVDDGPRVGGHRTEDLGDVVERQLVVSNQGFIFHPDNSDNSYWSLLLPKVIFSSIFIQFPEYAGTIQF